MNRTTPFLWPMLEPICCKVDWLLPTALPIASAALMSPITPAKVLAAGACRNVPAAASMVATPSPAPAAAVRP